MRLGIVVTDHGQGPTVLGVIEAAVRRGWNIRCFLTDTGVRLLNDAGFLAHARDGTAAVAVCELSIERYGQEEAHAELPESVVVGGQYQDAELVHETDSVLVF